MRQRNDSNPKVRLNRLRRTADAQGDYYIVKANLADVWFLLDATRQSNVARVCYSLDELEAALVNPPAIRDGSWSETVANSGRVDSAA